MRRFSDSFSKGVFSRSFSALRYNSAVFARRVPCAVMALPVIWILLVHALFPENCFLTAFLPAVFLLFAGCIFSLSDTVWKIALPGIIIWSSLLFRQAEIAGDPVKFFAANREKTGIIAVLRAEDASLSGGNGLLANPERIHCSLLYGAYSPLEKMHKIHGKVILRLPKGFSEKLSYGDILIAEGQLKRPSAVLLNSSFDYRSYLEKRSIHYILQADTVQKSHRETSPSSFILDLRDKFAGRIFTLLPEKNRSFASALLFGCAQNVKKETKNDLIRTGTIHILTVSGLHIGFFAAFAALLCILLPFHARMFLVPFLTFFYAWMTGLNMPALRAVIMLSAYCFARGCFLNSSAKNSLFFAFVLLMILYPMQFTDAGMHYSFITTFALLLAAENITQWCRLFLEKYAFIPAKSLSRKERFFRRLKYTVLRVFAGCCAAWGASCVLTLFYQGIATPFSVMVNFLFVPLVWIIFPVFFSGAFAGIFLPAAGNWTAAFLEKITDLLLGISHIAAGKSDLVLPRPAGYMVILFLLFFFLLLQEKKKEKFLLCAFAGVLALIFLFAGKLFPPSPELLVISGGGRRAHLGLGGGQGAHACARHPFPPVPFILCVTVERRCHVELPCPHFGAGQGLHYVCVCVCVCVCLCVCVTAQYRELFSLRDLKKAEVQEEVACTNILLKS